MSPDLGTPIQMTHSPATQPAKDTCMVRPMIKPDLESVVQIHLRSFPGFFLTFLGSRFLTLLYKNILDDHDGIILVAMVDGQIEGFVAGVTHQSGFYQRLIKRQKWAFAMAAFGALVSSPAIIPRLLRALKRPSEAHHATAEACLMSIAVRPESEGKGIGKQLVEALCRELAGRGVQAICLTTDRDNNDRVNQFYQKSGFRLGRTFVTPEGRSMNEYVITLN